MNPAPKSIVVVDDEASYAELISHLLGRVFTCPIHRFTHPVEALPAVARLNPAVIVTDFHMPHLNGPEFIRAAAVEVPEAAFLLMSGQHDFSTKSAAANLAPVRGTLAKPFSWRVLADEIIRVWPAGHPVPLRG